MTNRPDAKATTTTTTTTTTTATTTAAAAAETVLEHGHSMDSSSCEKESPSQYEDVCHGHTCVRQLHAAS
jgi:hypothetical protein